MVETTQGRMANLYIINTCTVTKKADRESLYAIRLSHRENPQAPIIVTGCMPEFCSPQLKKEPGVKLIVKNRDKGKIVAHIIKKHTMPDKGISFFEGHTRAFLKVQDGCANFCSYCIVPFVRGQPRSKPLGRIMAEARRLIDNGYREIVLTGICLGSYGRDLKHGHSLAEVVERMEKLPGIERIRLSSIEAKDVDEHLIKCFGRQGKLCRHIHIPIQSGDNDILSAMNRRDRREDYLELIVRLRKACPDISITTDVLVGFPGEEERHFDNTVGLIRRIMPLKAHIFPYSPRPDTKAFALKGRVPLNIVKNRIKRLSEIATYCARHIKKIPFLRYGCPH